MTNVSTVRALQQQNDIGDFQIAEALRLDDARKKARVIQQIKAREADIVQAMEEVFALMKKYGLTREDILDSRKISASSMSKVKAKPKAAMAMA